MKASPRPKPEMTQSIVVVDDDEPMREYLSEVLKSEGYECECFAEALGALSRLSDQEHKSDLVLTDIDMPGMDGVDLLRSVKSVTPNLPVVMLSGCYGEVLALDVVRHGAADYLIKPARRDEILKVVRKYLRPAIQNQGTLIREILADISTSHDRQGDVLGKVERIFELVGLKRFETQQHCKRVAAYASLLGQNYDLGRGQLDDLRLGALLHDVGKIAVPDNVLSRPGPLTEADIRIIRHHPKVGWELLSVFPELAGPAEIVYAHHERFDGTGYPRRFVGSAIPLGARMFSIVDTFDALTSARPYRRAQPVDESLAEIQRNASTQFDPALVDVFIKLPLDRLEEIRRASDNLQREPNVRPSCELLGG